MTFFGMKYLYKYIKFIILSLYQYHGLQNYQLMILTTSLTVPKSI